MKHTIDNILEVLNANTFRDPLTNCWIYKGATNKRGRGYCQIQFNDKAEYVHRLSAMLFLHYDLNSMEQINHKPNCPNSTCWNPLHLYVGTQQDNMKDVKDSGILKPELCQRGHNLTGTRPDGRRYCKECKLETQRNRRRNTADILLGK